MVMKCISYFENDRRHAACIVVCHMERMVDGNRQVFSVKENIWLIITNYVNNLIAY